MKRNSALILVFLVSFCCFSQQEELDGYSSEMLNSNNEAFTLLSSINSNQLITNDNLVSNQQNAILIQQIGNYNRIYSQTQSNSSDIELIQHGDNNNIDLSINAPSITGKISQDGNSNTVLNSIYYTNMNVNVNDQQIGDNLTINRIGVNSLTNKLRLVQQGSYKTITVISK